MSAYRPKQAPSQVQSIQSIVAHAYGLANRDCMLREIREARFCLPRQIAIYLTRKLTPCSWPETGRAFQQHHTTCMASADKIRKLTASDPEFALRVQELEVCVRRGIEAQVIEVKKTEIKKLEHMPAWAVRLEAKLDAVLGAR